MRKLFIAAALALASLTAAVVPAQAGSLIITTDDGPRYYRDDYDGYYDRGPRYYRDEYRPAYRQWYGPRYYRARCYTRSVERWRHGRMVIKESRVCE